MVDTVDEDVDTMMVFVENDSGDEENSERTNRDLKRFELFNENR